MSAGAPLGAAIPATVRLSAVRRRQAAAVFEPANANGPPKQAIGQTETDLTGVPAERDNRARRLAGLQKLHSAERAKAGTATRPSATTRPPLPRLAPVLMTTRSAATVSAAPMYAVDDLPKLHALRRPDHSNWPRRRTVVP